MMPLVIQVTFPRPIRSSQALQKTGLRMIARFDKPDGILLATIKSTDFLIENETAL